ncbi:16722_t:CDS:2, partial [Racocetra persica]
QYEAEDNNLVEEKQYEIENNTFVVDSEERENISIEPILGSGLEGLDPTQYPLITSSIELSVGTRFSSWEIAEYYLKEYGRQNGKYKSKKSKPIAQQRNKGSKRTDCKWHINLSSPKYTHYVYITFVYLEHNHSINADNKRFATAFRRFDKSIMAEIEHAVVYGQCDAYMIRNLFQPKFPDQLFLTQDLSNAIQKIKRDKKVKGSDASYLLKFLLNQQKEEPTIFVQPLINIDSNRLCSIFWMTANQILLWSRYFDVILHDNTSRTNKYNYPLSLFVLVDNEGKSRLGAQVFLNNETQESYEWVLQQILDATSSEPHVFITDMDPTMNAACKNIYKNTYYIHCIWHLSQNLPKRLKSKLGHKARNSLSVNVFEQQFQALIEKIFTAGMQSMQCVESINALIHKEVSSSSYMTDVVEAIDSRMQREALNAKRLFGNIKELIQNHLSYRIIEELKNQMCELVLYQCKKIEIDSAIEFNEDQLEQIVNREKHSDESNESEIVK